MRLFLCCLALAVLSGCTTNAQGEKKFNPWGAAKKADTDFEAWWLST